MTPLAKEGMHVRVVPAALGAFLMRLLFIDCETTGLDPATDQIISYTLQEWTIAGRGATWSHLVMPTKPIEDWQQAALLNHFDPRQWHAAAAIPFGHHDASFLHEKLDKSGGHLIAGHGLQFDLNFIAAEFARLGLAPPAHHYQVIDVRSMCAPLLVAGTVAKTSLIDCAAYFGLNTSRAHTADGDVELTIDVFERMLGLVWKGMLQ
jgi:DNA polymerase III epsilon subunit-like protein